MSNYGPLVLVDDDAEDQELLLLVLKELGFEHRVKTFKNAEAALSFLYESDELPFMIVSDINMPRMDGIEFKRTIDKCTKLSAKCIPFIFLSTSTKFVKDTCDLNIQGYFEKGNSWQDMQDTLKVILKYWELTRHVKAN
jgi:two-component SAPR family response regulator